MTTFQITLGETYYEHGYLHIPIEYDEYLTTESETIKLVLGEQGEVTAKVKRIVLATQQRVTRIFGEAALKNWFQKYFTVNDTIDITVASPDKLILQPSLALEAGASIREKVLQSVRQAFPGWDGFQFPPFVADEVYYKQRTVEKARELLGRDELTRLLAENAFDEILERIKKIGSDNNLLWRGVPKSGDLNILSAVDGMKAEFCRAFFDLLYGDGESGERLARYLMFVEEHKLPNKWTFPTYFLFVAHPQREIFIKPRTTGAFLAAIGQKARYSQKPTAAGYQSIKAVVELLRRNLEAYHPRDMVDIQSLMWVVAGSGNTGALAEPFASLFRDWDEANWALDFLRETLGRLGVTSLDDPRVALTVPVGRPLLRLNFGNWLIADFIGKGLAGLTLPENNLLDISTRSRSGFAKKLNEETHFYYGDISIEVLRDMSPELTILYEQSMQNIADRFRKWRGTPYRKAHQPELMAALFDMELRQKVLTEGIEAKGVSMPIDSEQKDGYFSPETIELMTALHESPRKETYRTRQDEYKEYVEQPLRQLMKDVVAILPQEITTVMETEKGLFSRVLKNDYGRGGAWDHYWGALYPKGGKRTEAPQLSMWVNHRGLEFGFYVGEYGSIDRRRLQENCREHHAILAVLLADLLGDTRFVAGRPDTFVFNLDGTLSDENATWRDWLKDPFTFGFDLSLILPFPEPLHFSTEELRDLVAQTYKQLFPLVLLATEDDPIPAIKRYLRIEINDTAPLNSEYSLEDMAEATGFALDELQRWTRALARKKQVVLYGPPGTGKTFIAEHLARYAIGGGDGFSELVQFHPAYAYEDFMQGIRPETGPDGSLSYTMKRGRFLDFCSRASERDGVCVLIIDEINRANLARVFGELMYLLEYRDRSIPLAGGRAFSIPRNVRIIGTMNTADRSIALVDHALRRRFAFLYQPPNYDVLRRFHQRKKNGFPVEALITQLQTLNQQIDDRHYEVGISFFLRESLADDIADIWQMEIEPYLEEYFFDRPNTVNGFRWKNVRRNLNL